MPGVVWKREFQFAFPDTPPSVVGWAGCCRQVPGSVSSSAGCCCSVPGVVWKRELKFAFPDTPPGVVGWAARCRQVPGSVSPSAVCCGCRQCPVLFSAVPVIGFRWCSQGTTYDRNGHRFSVVIPGIGGAPRGHYIQVLPGISLYVCMYIIYKCDNPGNDL